jgi:tRNA 5-methylaminomethyl-2-thiouridine biosynthesis bifunctional protein
LQAITDQLLAVYPQPCHGFHCRDLFQGRVRLLLLWGEADEMLADVNARVDAWYLDGFAPGKNVSLWRPQLFRTLANLTAPGGTFATYTAAGDVRRGLQSAGFDVSKQQGFGKKREMLCGSLASVTGSIQTVPWLHYTPTPVTEQRQVVVIGGGLAGVTSAVALAQRDWRVTLVEQQAQVAKGASGNPAGVVMPRLSADMSIEARFYLSAFLYVIHWLLKSQSDQSDISWHPSGVVQLLESAKQLAMAGLGLPESIVRRVDAAAIQDLIGCGAEQDGVIYPLAGWLQPRRLCEHLLQHQAGIELKTSTTIARLTRQEGQWQLWDEQKLIATAPVVVIATGHQAGRLLPEIPLEIQPVRGQLTYVRATGPFIKRPLCYDGYAIPLGDSQYCIGASYDRHSTEASLRGTDHESNLRSLQQAVKEFDYDAITGGRVAFRASSRDHLPLVGAVPDIDYYVQHYSDLHHGRPMGRYPLAEYQPGLYLNIGHGSRGLTSCPLTAEIIACMINQDPLPIPEDMRQALHPARFIVRSFRRRRG